MDKGIIITLMSIFLAFSTTSQASSVEISKDVRPLVLKEAVVTLGSDYCSDLVRLKKNRRCAVSLDYINSRLLPESSQTISVHTIPNNGVSRIWKEAMASSEVTSLIGLSGVLISLRDSLTDFEIENLYNQGELKIKIKFYTPQ